MHRCYTQDIQPMQAKYHPNPSLLNTGLSSFQDKTK